MRKNTDFSTLAHVTSFIMGKNDLVLDGTENRRTLTCSHFIKDFLCRLQLVKKMGFKFW